LLLANLLVRQKNFEGAKEHIDRVLKGSPNDLLALQAKSSLLGIMGDKAGVYAVLREIRDSHPDKSAAAQFRLGQLYLSEKKYDKAIVEFENALKAIPDSVRALAGVVNTYLAAEEPNKAVGRIDAFLKAYPKNPVAFAMLGQVNLGMKNYPEAVEWLKKALEIKPDYKAAMSSLFSAYEVQNKGDEADAYLQKLLTDNPKHPLAYTFLAISRISKQDYATAERLLKKAIAANPSQGQYYGLLAYLYNVQKDPDKSIETYLEGVGADPKNVRLRLNLAEMYQMQNQMEKAVETYEEILDTDSNNVLARNNLAAILSDFRHDRQSYEKALDLASNFKDAEQPMLLDTLGWIYVKLGNYKEAVSILNKAAKKAPEEAIFQYHLGMAYYKDGDKVKAKDHLSEALKPGKPFQGSEEARMIRERL